MLKKFLAKLTGPKRRTPLKKETTPPKKGKSRAEAKERKPAPLKRQAPPPGAGKEIGRVVVFFRLPVVAVIRVTQGGLKLGDQIWIKGHTTDLKQTITSMQINNQPIQEARKGDEAGVRISSRARRGDRVYRLTP